MKPKPSKPTIKKRRAIYDSPWKVAVERLFPHFLEFFFPDIHALIDWDRPYKFLSQELEQISAGIEGELNQQRRGYRRGNRAPLRVDVLVEVYFNDGSKGRILLHLEIQNERDPFFDERLFIYHYRIFDKTRDRVITLALLTDFDPAWRPGKYTRELAGCRVDFQFPAKKVLDYNAIDIAESKSPFAFIAQAHINARETGGDLLRRYDLRMALQDAVDASEMKKREILLVTRFIEEVMVLPGELDQKLFFERKARKESNLMEYTTYAERIGERRGVRKGIKKGKAESKRDSVLKLLEMRFKRVPKRVMAKLSELDDLALLDELFTKAFHSNSLKEFESHLPAQ